MADDTRLKNGFRFLSDRIWTAIQRGDNVIDAYAAVLQRAVEVTREQTRCGDNTDEAIVELLLREPAEMRARLRKEGANG